MPARAWVTDLPAMLDEDGRQVSVVQIADGNAVLVYFMRAFSCRSCRGHVRSLVQQQSSLQAAGVRTVVVGPGSPADARRLRTTVAAGLPVLADPEAAGYTQAQLGSTLGIRHSGPFLFDSSGALRWSRPGTLPASIPVDEALRALGAPAA